MNLKKTFVNIGVLVVIILGTFFITRNWFTPKVQPIIQTDTLYVDKPYKPKVVEEGQNPETVKIYKTDVDTIKTIKVVKDTVYVQTKDEDVYEYDANYLTNYTTAPKLLGLSENNNGKLKLSYFTIGGVAKTKIWDVTQKNYVIGLSSTGEPMINTYSKTDHFDVNFSLSSGYIFGLEYGSPYLQGMAGVELFGVDVQAGFNINKRPFATVGISYTW